MDNLNFYTVEKVAIDKNNNRYLVGKFSNSLTFGPYTIDESQNYHASYIGKFSSENECVWLKKIYTSPFKHSVANQVFCDSAGNIFVSGSVGGFFMDVYEVEHSFLARYDSNGLQKWIKSPLAGIDKITDDKQGNIYVHGGVKYDHDFLGTPILAEGKTGYLSKVNASGELMWFKKLTFGKSSYVNHYHFIASDTVGDVYITGRFKDSVTFGPHVLSTINKNYEDVYVIKVNSNGDFLYSNIISSTGNYDDISSDIIVNSRNNALAFWTVNFSNNYTVVNKGSTGKTATQFTFGYSGVLLSKELQPSSYNGFLYAGKDLVNAISNPVFFKFDSLGWYEWEVYLNGNSSDATINTFAIDDSGRIHAYGYYKEATTLESSGYKISNKATSGRPFYLSIVDTTFKTITAHEERKGGDNMGHINIIFERNSKTLKLILDPDSYHRNDPLMVEIFDNTGRKVLKQKLHNELNDLDLNFLSPGFYFSWVINSQKILQKKSIVISD